jgi:phosphoribosylanthranilate isomerase
MPLYDVILNVLQRKNMQIKICGITNRYDGLFAIEYGADYLGFIFYDKSPRYIDPELLKEWIGELHGIKKVGVFVNNPIDDIITIVKICDLDVVQLHGEESDADIYKLKEFGVEVWRAFGLRFSEDVQRAAVCKADKVLVDSITEKEYGGTGKVSNWELASKLAGKRDVVLAGGLNPDNVVEAIKEVKPFCIDVSSGVELKPGKKDLTKLEKFLKLGNI